jgi:hypothetical protein
MNRTFTVTVDLRDIEKIDQLGGRMTPIVNESINKTISQIFVESQNLVPVDTGALKASGHINTQSVPYSIEYGGGGYWTGETGRGKVVDYAVVVHEDMSVNHNPPTQAKYLELPLVQNQQVLIDNIRTKITQFFSRSR